MKWLFDQNDHAVYSTYHDLHYINLHKSSNFQIQPQVGMLSQNNFRLVVNLVINLASILEMISTIHKSQANSHSLPHIYFPKICYLRNLQFRLHVIFIKYSLQLKLIIRVFYEYLSASSTLLFAFKNSFLALSWAFFSLSKFRLARLMDSIASFMETEFIEHCNSCRISLDEFFFLFFIFCMMNAKETLPKKLYNIIKCSEI